MIERIASNRGQNRSILRHPIAALGAGKSAYRHKAILQYDYQRMHNAYSVVEQLQSKL